MSSKIDEIQKFVDTVGSCGLYPDKAAEHIRYLLSLKDGGVEGRDPADMTDDELNAAIDFHRRQIARYSNEAAKIWRLRIRLNGGEDIDKRMLAELHERRATASTETSERCGERCGHDNEYRGKDGQCWALALGPEPLGGMVYCGHRCTEQGKTHG